MTRYLLGFLLIAGMAWGQEVKGIPTLPPETIITAPLQVTSNNGKPILTWDERGNLTVHIGVVGPSAYHLPAIKRVIVVDGPAEFKLNGETRWNKAPKPEQFGQWHDDGILKPAPGNLVGGRINLPIPEEIHPCSATPNQDVVNQARLDVMQKALAYIAKMAARNPKEEQDAGEFLEKMGRILAGSEK